MKPSYYMAERFNDSKGKIIFDLRRIYSSKCLISKTFLGLVSYSGMFDVTINL